MLALKTSSSEIIVHPDQVTKKNYRRDVHLREANHNLIHQNIVNYLSIDFETITLPLATASLANLIHAGINPENYVNFIKQILTGVVFLNSCGIWHRDLKPDNILYFPDHTLKIADLGSSWNIRYYCGLRTYFKPYHIAYRAPEIELFDNQPPEICLKSDMWAVGIIIMDILSGRQTVKPGKFDDYPWKQIFMFCQPSVEYLTEIRRSHPNFVVTGVVNLDYQLWHLRPELQNLIKGLLTFDPDKRLSWRQCIDTIYCDKNSDGFIQNFDIQQFEHEKCQTYLTTINSYLMQIYQQESESYKQARELVWKIFYYLAGNNMNIIDQIFEYFLIGAVILTMTYLSIELKIQSQIFNLPEWRIEKIRDHLMHLVSGKIPVDISTYVI